MFISFRTSYYDNEGLEVMEGKKIAKHYLKTGKFFADFIGSFPFDRIITAFTGPNKAVSLVCKSLWLRFV